MKKLFAVLLLAFLVVGCAPAEVKEEVGAGGYTEEEIETVVFKAVQEYERQKLPYIKKAEWVPTDEVVDGIKKDLYNITGYYEWEDKDYKVRLLMQAFPGKKYKLIRYHNITTGKQLE